MKKYIFIFIFLSAFSCNNQTSKYHQQFVVAHEFLNKLKGDDTAGVKEMIGPALSDIDKNEEIFSFEVNQLSQLLQLRNLPDEKTYRLTEYSSTDARLLNMMIPIGNDTLEIEFAKFLPTNKIWWYIWHRQITNDNLITLPPDSLKR